MKNAIEPMPQLSPRPPGIHKVQPTKGGGGGGGGGSSKTLLLVILAVILAGALYGAFAIQSFMFTSRFDEALSNVLDTRQYERITTKRLKKQLREAYQKAKVDPSKVKSYVSTQPKSEFAELGSYFLNRRFKGYKSAQSNRSTKIPGCTLADAMPPGTTARKLTASTAAGKGSMTNRAGALAANDAKGVLTGQTPQTSAPPGTIVLSIDVLLDFKYLVFKKKMWFHRRCYFYEKRRAYDPIKETNKALGKGDD